MNTVKKTILLTLTVCILLSVCCVAGAAADDASLTLTAVYDEDADTVTVTAVTAKEIIAANYDLSLTGWSDAFTISAISCSVTDFIAVSNVNNGHISAMSKTYYDVTIPAGTVLAAYTLKPVDALSGAYTFTLTVADAADENGDAIAWKGTVVTASLEFTEPEPAAENAAITGCSLELNGYIRLNFYVALPDSYVADAGAYATMTQNKDGVELSTTVAIPSPETEGEQAGSYKLSYDLAAKEMRDDVTLRLYTGENSAYTIENHPNGYTFSVQDYFNAAHSQYGDNESLMALIDRMSDYGNLAQLYFGYNDTGAAVSADTQAAMDQVTADTLAGYAAASYTDPADDGIEYIGSSLTLRSGTKIRHYFSTEDVSPYSFRVNNVKAEPVEVGDGYYCIEIDTIAAKELDTTYSLAVWRAPGTLVFSNNYSALSYVYSVLKSGEADESLVNLVKGLYLYNQAANAYFGA